MSKEQPALLCEYDEEILADLYACALCSACREGDCDIANAGDEHDTSVYWNLPDEERTGLVSRIRVAVGFSTVPEAMNLVVDGVLHRYFRGLPH